MREHTRTYIIKNILGVLIFFLLSGSTILYAQDDIWQVGVARVDITPEDSLWLAGYASRDHAGGEALHQLWAKSIALQDQNGKKAVLITADVLGFPKIMSDHIRSKCKEKYGLDRSQIILSSSHTHTGPVLRESLYIVYPLNEDHIKNIEDYSDNLEKQVINLIGTALKNMAPARLYSANGVVRFQVNRRNNNVKYLSAQADLNGPNDYAVPVLQARDLEGKLIAISFGYACHPTVLNSYRWSGDYPGFAQLALEDRFPGTTALFFQGCGADQNPLPRRSVSLARQYGEELAAAVGSVIEENLTPLSSDLKTGYKEIDLALNSPPSKEALEKLFLESKSAYQKNWALKRLNELDKNISVPEKYLYPIQGWQLGDQHIFTLGGEVVIDYAITLKRLFGQEAFVMGYCNDVMGYIPSLRILREGGYEGATSQIVYDMPSTWRADIESKIISGVIDLAQRTGIKLPESKLISD